MAMFAGNPGIVLRDDLFPAGSGQGGVSQLAGRRECGVTVEPDIRRSLVIGADAHQKRTAMEGVWL